MTKTRSSQEVPGGGSMRTTRDIMRARAFSEAGAQEIAKGGTRRFVVRVHDGWVVGIGSWDKSKGSRGQNWVARRVDSGAEG